MFFKLGANVSLNQTLKSDCLNIIQLTKEHVSFGKKPWWHTPNMSYVRFMYVFWPIIPSVLGQSEPFCPMQQRTTEVNSDIKAAHYTCTRFTRHASETLRCSHPVSLQLLKEDKCVSLWEQEIWVQETGQAGLKTSTQTESRTCELYSELVSHCLHTWGWVFMSMTCQHM